MSKALTAEFFTPHLGKPFHFEGDHALTLVEVKMHDTTAANAAFRRPFTLILRGPRSPVLPEGLYRVTIDEAETIALYVIPIATMVRDRQDYQVAFN